MGVGKMKSFALTNTDMAYDNWIYGYRKAESEKDLLNLWIQSDENFKDCKVIRKPKGIMLKHGAKYCFEHNKKYYYVYEVS